MTAKDTIKNKDHLLYVCIFLKHTATSTTKMYFFFKKHFFCITESINHFLQVSGGIVGEQCGGIAD